MTILLLKTLNYSLQDIQDIQEKEKTGKIKIQDDIKKLLEQEIKKLEEIRKLEEVKKVESNWVSCSIL